MHVPKERLEEYRKITARYHELQRLGNARSGVGDYAGANRAWTIAALARVEANNLRVPGGPENEQGDRKQGAGG